MTNSPRLDSCDWQRGARVAGLGARGDCLYGETIAVGLDVRGTTLVAHGWGQEGGDL